MIRIFSVSFLLLGLLCADPKSSTVRFINGDQLTGEVLSFTPEALSWTSPMLVEPAVFPIENVLDVTMTSPNGRQDRLQGGHEAKIHMTNGDVFHGQLSGLNDDAVKLKTWYADDLVLKTVNVREVTIQPASEIIYRGPNSMEEWTQSDGTDRWLFRDGALEAEGPTGIAKEIDFPDEFQIEFVAEWRGNFRPKVVFLSGDIDSVDPDTGYTIVFQGNSVLLRKSGSNDWLGRAANAGNLRENEKATLLLQVSQKAGKILLFVDGERIQLWEDGEMAAATLGDCLHFIAQGDTPLRISDLEVTNWDGYIEEVNPQVQLRGNRFDGGFDSGIPETQKEVIEEGRMVLRNGDSMKGEITGVKGDMVTVKTEFSEVEIPIERLHNLILQESKMETPKRNKGDIRAHMKDGSRVVFRIDEVEDDYLVGFSQNFGTAKFSREAFDKIEFNIYPRFGEKRPIFSRW